MITGGCPVRVAVFKAHLGVIRSGNVLGYPIIDGQKFLRRHLFAFWLVAWIPQLDHGFFPLIGNSAAIHRIVGDCFDFGNMVSDLDEWCSIKLKDKLLIGFDATQSVQGRNNSIGVF
jgi:hypothetical protein